VVLLWYSGSKKKRDEKATVKIRQPISKISGGHQAKPKTKAGRLFLYREAVMRIKVCVRSSKVLKINRKIRWWSFRGGIHGRARLKFPDAHDYQPRATGK